MWRSFLYSSSVYSCCLFLISSASVRSLFLFLIEPIFTWNVPYISLIFLKRSLVFPILLFSSISLHCSFKKVYLSLLFSGALHSDGYIFPFLPCLSHHFFPQVFIKSPQTTTLPSCISFSLGWFWSLPPIQCYEPPSTVVHVLCLSDPIPWIYSWLPLNSYKGFDLSHTWMV